MISIKWKGVNAAQRRIVKVKKVTPEVEAAVADAGSEMQSESRDNAPVDTGTLVNSITLTMLAASLAMVEVLAHYGGFVEFGTVKMKAQPYFTPAFEKTSRSFKRKLKRILKGA